MSTREHENKKHMLHNPQETMMRISVGDLTLFPLWNFVAHSYFLFLFQFLFFFLCLGKLFQDFQKNLKFSDSKKKIHHFIFIFTKDWRKKFRRKILKYFHRNFLLFLLLLLKLLKKSHKINHWKEISLPLIFPIDLIAVKASLKIQ